ncbi:MAG: hypothetical protein ACTHM6_06405 [Tepidisphaeraceae bacterium]
MSLSSDAEYRRVHSAAVAIAATEAALFVVPDPPTVDSLETVFHIRPGRGEQKDRSAAELAFKQIVGQCLAASKDGIIEILQSDSPVGRQFCFVHFGRRASRITRAAAYIRRCETAEVTRSVLKQLQDQRIFG